MTSRRRPCLFLALLLPEMRGEVRAWLDVPAHLSMARTCRTLYREAPTLALPSAARSLWNQIRHEPNRAYRRRVRETLRQLVPTGVLGWRGHDQPSSLISVVEGSPPLVQFSWTWVWCAAAPSGDDDVPVMCLTYLVPHAAAPPWWSVRRGTARRIDGSGKRWHFDVQNVIGAALTPATLPPDALAALRFFVGQPRR